jgi:F-type H+-transporting ATPase subunit b
LKKATDDANAERERLLAEARKAADDLGEKRRETMRNDAHHLSDAVRRRAQEEVFAIARKALTDLSSATLEERMAEVFLRRFGEMDGAAKATLGDAIKKAEGPVVVRSAFDLPEKQRAAIQDALNRAFSADVRIRFETAPDLVSGIDLATEGHKVGWSIADYLGSLEKGVAELLKEKETAAAKVDAKPQPSPKASKLEAKPEPKPKASPTPKPDATEVKPEPKAEPKPVNEPAAKSP